MTKQGLKENLPQFILLVVINAFVGGMVGLERSIFPRFAEEVYHISSSLAILNFIVAFGISKAITNYFTGRLSNFLGRRNILVLGWILALPIPFIFIYAESWSLIIFANILLGISQGMTWSTTVVMKIELAGAKDRGLAMGLNEFAGYLSVGIIAFLSGMIAENYGLRVYPFYLGIALSIIGFLLSIFLVKDTKSLMQTEIQEKDDTKTQQNVFFETTFKNKTLSSITQAGLVNNLNDGMIWGLFPILLISYGYSDQKIGILAAIYPIIWGMGQLFTGRLADLHNNKNMLFWGMFLQALAIAAISRFHNFFPLALAAILLGIGTALVYPTFLVALSKVTHPKQRAESIGVFRLWRDLGYAFGAIISGYSADLLGIPSAILLIAVITLISAVIIKIRMPDVS